MAAVLALAASLLAGYHVAWFQGVDQNGYILSAKRLATLGHAGKVTADPLEFVSGNWVEVSEGVFYAKYPIGYPMLCALAYRLGGPSAVFFVNPLLSLLGVAGLFFLGRALSGPFAGAMAALLLATNPVHIEFGLAALSHAGSLCFATWGMFLLWRWAEHGGRVRALLAGALSAYAVTIRYTEGLLLLPMALLVLLRLRAAAAAPAGTARRTALAGWLTEVACMGLGAAFAVIPLLAHHLMAYGSPLSSGYALCGESTGFGWHWFRENFWLMLDRMNDAGLQVVFPLGMAGMVYLLLTRRRQGAFLALWTIPALLLYSAYYWAPRGDGIGYLRFFVSVFPPLIAGAVALLGSIAGGVRSRAITAFVVLLAAACNVRDASEQLGRLSEQLNFAKTTADVLRRELPEDATVVAGRGILESLEYARDYHLYATETFNRRDLNNILQVLADQGPRPFQRRKARTLSDRLGGKSSGELTSVLQGVVSNRLAGGGTVAVIDRQDAFRTLRGRLGPGFLVVPAANWSEIRFDRTKERDPLVATGWTLYRIVPRADPDAEVTPAERLDQLEAMLRAKNDELNRRFPDAHAELTAIQSIQDEIRYIRSGKPAPQRARATDATASPLRRKDSI